MVLATIHLAMAYLGMNWRQWGSLMSQQTPNRGYVYPDEYSDSWYNEFVAMLTQIDTDMQLALAQVQPTVIVLPTTAGIIYGTYAGIKLQAASAPTIMCLGFATDMNQLFFYTANAGMGDGGWILLGGG